ncbi:MAG: DUF1611 domain-containing protein [Thermoanaerobaculia bacterium]
MDGTAIVLCEGYFRTANGKTAHGLVRGSNRYRILGIVDPPTAGKEAGEVLDGKTRGIPVYASIPEALERCPTKPDYAIVGVATAGGRFTPGLRASLSEVIERGLSIVNGLHEFASEDGGLAAAARRKGVRILDVRKPRPTSELRFWTGEIRNVSTPRVAVLGTDCAIGKRTTLGLLAEACNRRDLRTEWISTGQTGWMQGAPFGILLDALPNDFVSGELEHAIVSCARELAPDLILIEGQSSLRNPSGPCGSELIVSGGVRGVVLQHAPGRLYFEGFEGEESRIPPVAEEIELIRLLGARTLALTLNGEGLARERLELEREKLQRELRIPVALPLEEGVESLVPVLRSFIRSQKAP